MGTQVLGAGGVWRQSGDRLTGELSPPLGKNIRKTDEADFHVGNGSKGQNESRCPKASDKVMCMGIFLNLRASKYHFE